MRPFYRDTLGIVTAVRITCAARVMSTCVYSQCLRELQISRGGEKDSESVYVCVREGVRKCHFANFAPHRCQVLSPRLFAHHIRNLLSKRPRRYCSLHSSGRARRVSNLISASCRGHAPTWWIHSARIACIRPVGTINVPNFHRFPSRSCRGRTFARWLLFRAQQILDFALGSLPPGGTIKHLRVICFKLCIRKQREGGGELNSMRFWHTAYIIIIRRNGYIVQVVKRNSSVNYI